MLQNLWSASAVFVFCVATALAQPTATPANTTASQTAAELTPAEAEAQNALFLQQQTAAKGELLPSITNEKMQDLFKNLVSIDYVFYNTDFTISIDEKNARQNLFYFSTRAAKKLDGQKAVGRAFYVANGDIALSAEIYFGATQLERYFVFLKDDKPYAANYISPQGATFFDQVVKARVEMRPKAGAVDDGH